MKENSVYTLPISITPPESGASKAKPGTAPPARARAASPTILIDRTDNLVERHTRVELCPAPLAFGCALVWLHPLCGGPAAPARGGGCSESFLWVGSRGAAARGLYYYSASGNKAYC